MSPADLLKRASRWKRVAEYFMRDQVNHWGLSFACGKEWHRIAAVLKAEHGISIYE